MKLSAKSHAALTAAVQEALGRYLHGEENSVVTDIHFQPKSDSGELVIYNDDDEELARTILEEWVEYADDDFYAQVEHLLRTELNALKSQGALDKLCIMRPFSFVLVDDEKETVTDLLLMDDDDTLLLNEDLLKGLDEELDDFLKKLLEE
jgi:hypothetical protein